MSVSWSLVGSKEYFDRVAKRWDEMRAGFFSESLRERAFAVAGVESGRTAVDVGTGSGFITEGLVGRGLSVIAVDQSEAMLGELKRKLASRGKIDCRVGDAMMLPLPSSSVDYAFANMCLHHVDSPARAIKEMARVVKSRGKVVITDLEEHDFGFLREECHDQWLGFKKEYVRRWLKGAGLKGVSVRSTCDRCCAASRCGCDIASVGIFVAVGEK
jgi:ubiquinone/menaquinone biosynthesis C-methylase UbiE